MGDMKLYTFEEILDEHYGKPGTPARDNFERKAEEALHEYYIGEAIISAKPSRRRGRQRTSRKSN